MKKCSKCFKTFILDNFYKKPNSKDGLQSWCKDCDNRRHKLWRKNHPGHSAKMSKLQRVRNPEKMRMFVREYQKKHPREAWARVKKWREKNVYKTSAHKKVYYAIKTGKLVRENCFCGKKAHAHHEDYSKPLEVLWLCAVHHKKRHAELLKNKGVIRSLVW